jgi:hypothetical protein
MNETSDWKTAFEAELARAASVRAGGNEGQARVCARRAAGLAIREYARRNGLVPPSNSAYDLLGWLAGRPGLDPDLRSASVKLTQRVTEEFRLPLQADLIAEARLLARGLLGD